MLGFRGLIVLVTFTASSAACSVVDQPGEPKPGAAQTAERLGRANPARVDASGTPQSATTHLPLPTAVRVLSNDPRDVVLRDMDLPQGFHLSAEYPTQAVELWPTRAAVVESRPLIVGPPSWKDTGTGHYAVLAHSDGADGEGLVSIATTAVRYERTAGAAQAFALAVASAPPALEDTTVITRIRNGDDVSAWRYRLVGAVVDQVITRTRNYVLAVTLVHYPAAGESALAPRYAGLLRSKLRD
jgi:hypothetical protein